MDEQYRELLAEFSTQTFTSVARNVLGDPKARLLGDPVWNPVGGRHGDLQTVAVLKCSGNAISNGVEVTWSAVLKHIDLTVEPNFHSAWVEPMNEIALYRSGGLSKIETPFRPAKCYLVEQHDENRISLWIEDLSAAPDPPWSADLYAHAAKCLGTHQGLMLSERVKLDFVEESDRFATRWGGWNLGQVLDVLKNNRDHPDLQIAYPGDQFDLLVGLMESFPKLLDRVGTVEKVISHGDCHARNLFPLKNLTVAIDWSGISYEPVGSDFGQLIGAGLTWGVNEKITVAEAIPNLTQAYLEGLSSTGFDTSEGNVRLGMAGQLSGYVIIAASSAARAIYDPEFAKLAEGRTGISPEELPDASRNFVESTEPLMRELINLAS